MTTATRGANQSPAGFFPHEHGATAMLLMPFCAAAILARALRWQEAAALAAIVCVFMARDPLVVLARQRWVWKQHHPEAALAVRWIAAELSVMLACGVSLLATGPWQLYLLLFGAAAAFSGLAILVNVRNRQRGTAFQVASAVVLTSTSLVAALSATGSIPPWCWRLWGLTAAQSAAGIFTVHSRLDARVAARTGNLASNSRRPAIFCIVLLGVAGIALAAAGSYWLGAALLVAASGYGAELARQKSTASLQMPLTRVGLQMLALSLLYGAIVVRGLW